jgi:hypothetical protein
MIHIVRVWMENQSHFIIGDDDDAVNMKVGEWLTRGGRVVNHTVVNEPELGMVITRRKEETACKKSCVVSSF